MSKTTKKRNSRKGTTDKQMLAALELPAVGREAELPVERTADDMTTTAESSEPVKLDTPPTAPVAVEEPAEPAAATAEGATAAPVHLTLGQRLRHGREVRGWSAEDVGSKLHLPLQLIQKLEAEQYERIGYGIYLRGYLTNYARLVDVPTILVDAVVRQDDHAPPLVASGTISHSRYLYQRYSVSALYLILTGVIIVPAVLLAMRAGLQPSVVELTSLEAPASTTADGGSASPSSPDKAPVATAAPASADAQPPAGVGNDAPLVASLAPFSALSHNAPAPAPVAATPVAGAHTLKLTLREASWVEVMSAGGDKLEFGLLPAGSTRTYSSDGALEVRLGNCSGAEIEADGKPQDLAPYRRANVARFKLFAAGETISRTD